MKAPRYFALMSVDGLRMAQDALNSYAAQMERTTSKECPIVNRWETAHSTVAQFLNNPEKRQQWQCPFCGEKFQATPGTIRTL